jgi:fido (protein-threonine AMPylation protein)
MSDPLAEPDDGAPLTDEESQGLLLPVLTRKELNRAEAENIAQAMTWVFLSRRRLRPESVAREAWLQRLHRRMYDQVWAWAGQYRTTDRNLGVPYWQTRMDMRDLEVDVQAWLADTGTARFSDDECAIPQAAIFRVHTASHELSRIDGVDSFPWASDNYTGRPDLSRGPQL